LKVWKKNVCQRDILIIVLKKKGMLENQYSDGQTEVKMIITLFTVKISWQHKKYL
jgi:hypothetical protein